MCQSSYFFVLLDIVVLISKANLVELNAKTEKLQKNREIDYSMTCYHILSHF